MLDPIAEHLAVSFDGPASPSFALRGEVSGQPSLLGAAWGLAWYSDNQRAATTLVNADLPLGTAFSDYLTRSGPVRSSIFLANTRELGAQEESADLLVRPYAGRHWLLSCTGTLGPETRVELSLDDSFDVAPVESGPLEHALSWLLARVRQQGCSTIYEFGWRELHTLLQRVNQLGPVSFLLSDGIDVVGYRDASDQVPLHWTRRTPPHEKTALSGRSVFVDYDGPMDTLRTLLAMSTLPMRGAAWTPFEPGELRVARRGASVWSSHPSAIDEQVYGQLAGRDEAHGAAQQQQQLASVAVEPAPPSAPQPGRALLSVDHTTVYRYNEPVERSSHRFCLRPVGDLRQAIHAHELKISVDGVYRDFDDVFGNRATLLEVSEPFEEMRIESRSTVSVAGLSASEFESPIRRDRIPLVWMPWQQQMLQAYLMPPELPEPALRELTEFAMSFVERNDYDLVETLLDLNRTIYRDFTYVPGSTHLETTAFQVYAERRGVCQDFANVLICVARLLGVPARYRVGYIYTGGSYENKIQSDASHAWAEVYLPWAGWFGFDPTNGCLAGSDHIRIACGRNYRDAAPTSGTIYRGGGGEALEVAVRVERLDDPDVDGA